MKKNQLKWNEWLYSLIGFILVAVGTSLAIISLVGDYMAVASNLNWVFIAENAVIEFTTWPLDFLAYGSILVVIGTLMVVISLLVSANQEQIQKEKAVRRANRLAESLKDS